MIGETFQLSFTDIHIRGGDVFEVVPYEGVEIDLQCVHEYHRFFAKHSANSAYLVVDRINCFSYSGEAQKSILEFPELRSVAMICHSSVQLSVMKIMLNSRPFREFQSAIFDSRDSAFEWTIALSQTARARLG